MGEMADSGPAHVSRALSELFAIRGYARVDSTRLLQEIWAQVAGPDIAGGSQPIRIQRGVLQIGVATSVLLSELTGFHQQDLLARLKQGHPELRIRSLKFMLRSRPPAKGEK